MADTHAFTGALIYDGECPFCSTAAVAIKKIEGVGIIAWDDDASQQFLTAQFEDVPFSLVLVDLDSELVYVGPDAARELADRAGMPGLVGSLIGDNYDTMATAVQRTVGRGKPPDDASGVEPVQAVDEARALVEAAQTHEDFEEV